MKLITAADTLDFLSKSAPRPWLKRMLCWMIQQGELQAYATGGRITPHTYIFSLYAESWQPDQTAEELDKQIRTDYGNEIADSIVGKERTDLVSDDTTEWNDADEIRQVAIGVIMFGDAIDWENGLINTEIDGTIIKDLYYLFNDEEMFSSQFEKPDYEVVFTGICFSRDEIEMMLPTSDFPQLTVGPPARQAASIGRPRNWDWEGALAHIVSVANHPDGLPGGDGAQARIEEILKDWFVGETGGSPADSQIRDRERAVLRTLSPKKAISPF